jgi:1,4-dihydroxy-2-naphthoate octaprenyltransferase
VRERIFWVFILVHLFLYPASNGYNSYFDKDEKSIGGLKNPPPVNKGLYCLALLLDAIAIIVGYLQLGILFAAMLLLYGLVSKAYSHPLIRLKKLPYIGWIITGLFQGFFTFLMCYAGLNNFDLGDMMTPEVLVPGMLSTMILWGSYPMTQVYQHEEDLKRGDITLSLKLGIKGTFYFTALVFTLAVTGFVYFFLAFHKAIYALVFAVALTPVLGYFSYWLIKVLKDERNADFSHTMRLNWISSTCLNAFFLYFLLDGAHALQAIRSGY